MKKEILQRSYIKIAASINGVFGGGANFVQRTIGAVKKMGLGTNTAKIPSTATMPKPSKAPTALSTKKTMGGNTSIKRQVRPINLQNTFKQDLGGVNH